MKPRLLLIGAGGHARACIDVIEQEGRLSIGGLLGLPSEVGGTVLGYPVIAKDVDVSLIAPDFEYGLIVVGQIKTPQLRIDLYDLLLNSGLRPAVVVSPRAYVSTHATLGDGTIVMHGAVVNASATVGRNCIVNSQSLIEHDAEVGDHCHISTSSVLNSGVSVGHGSFVGSGAAVRQGVRIGRNCIIGIGQTVLKDCADGVQLPPLVERR